MLKRLAGVIRRERNSKRSNFRFKSDSPSAWDDKAASNQRLIAGKAVRTEGNPWKDSDGGAGQIGENVTSAWKSGGY